MSLVSCLIVGSLLRRTASRIHIAVLGSSRPSDKYSAVPSIIHRGRLIYPAASSAGAI